MAKGEHVLVVVPAYMKQLLEKRAAAETRSVSGLIKHFIMVCMRADLDAAGYGEVNFNRGGIMVSRGDSRGTAEVQDMSSGPGDDPLENLARNFLDIPGDS